MPPEILCDIAARVHHHKTITSLRLASKSLCSAYDTTVTTLETSRLVTVRATTMPHLSMARKFLRKLTALRELLIHVPGEHELVEIIEVRSHAHGGYRGYHGLTPFCLKNLTLCLAFCFPDHSQVQMRRLLRLHNNMARLEANK